MNDDIFDLTFGKVETTAYAYVAHGSVAGFPGRISAWMDEHSDRARGIAQPNRHVRKEGVKTKCVELIESCF